MSNSLPQGRAARTARLSRLAIGQGVRFSTSSALDKLRSEDGARRAQSARTMALADALLDQLGSMRGAAMKFGQVLSTIDLPGLSDEDSSYFKGRLASLRDAVEPQPWSVTQPMIEQELGDKLTNLFSEFDPEAFAAASIGQVHRATTLDGVEVAVKVQYQGVAEAVEVDLKNAYLLLPMLKRLAPGLDGRAFLGELGERVVEELDYELEADRTRMIFRALRGHPFLIVPSVHRSLSARRVLTTDFIEGQGFSDLAASSQEARNLAAEQIFRFFFGLLLYKNIALGDPHPGNFLRVSDRMAFLDFGMQRSVPGEYLELERELARAVAAGDDQLVHRNLSKLGYLPDPSGFDAQLLREQLYLSGSWYFEPGVKQIDSALVSQLALLAASPSSPFFEQTRRLTVPPEGVLIRRMESMLFSVLGELRATLDFHALASEYFASGPPSNQLGEADQAFWSSRP